MQTHKKELKIGALILGVLLLGVLVNQSRANIIRDDPTSRETFQNYTFFATSTNQVVTGSVLRYATTTASNSTSITSWFDDNGRKDNGYFVVKGAKRIEMYFGHGAATNTSASEGIFKVQTSPDGSDWYDFGKLILATTTNQTLQATVNVTGTTTTQASLKLDADSIFAIRCVIAVTAGLVDGTHTCSASADW